MFLKLFFRYVLVILLSVLAGCKGIEEIDLPGIRFIFLFILFFAMAIAVISSYKNGGGK